MSIKNTQIIYAAHPTEYPEAGVHMQVKTSTFDLEQPLKENELIVRNLVLSVDPYMRGRMRDASIKSYSPAFELGKTMTGSTLSVVLRSNNPRFAKDDLIYAGPGIGIFEEYSLISGPLSNYFKLRNDPKETGLPLTNYVGVLGMPGMTAYVGLYKFGEPKKGETLYISAASGAVGQLVGQIGKALGLYVVGSAGSDDKVAYLKSIGFDDAFNYKTSDPKQKLGEVCPNGIDIYFENVGGKMLEAVIDHANDFARIVCCGMISQYNRQQPDGIHNLMKVVAKRLKLQGFIVSDSPEMEEPFIRDVTKMLLEGKVHYKETLYEGIEKTPEALIDVLKGNNFGKAVVKIADL